MSDVITVLQYKKDSIVSKCSFVKRIRIIGRMLVPGSRFYRIKIIVCNIICGRIIAMIKINYYSTALILFFFRWVFL